MSFCSFGMCNHRIGTCQRCLSMIRVEDVDRRGGMFRGSWLERKIGVCSEKWGGGLFSENEYTPRFLLLFFREMLLFKILGRGAISDKTNGWIRGRRLEKTIMVNP